MVARLDRDIHEWEDRGVEPGTRYTYRVRAGNSDGVSAFSNEAGVVTPIPPPAAPSDLELLIGAVLTLRWRDNSDNEEYFVVERHIGALPFLEQGRESANKNTFTDGDIYSRHRVHVSC